MATVNRVDMCNGRLIPQLLRYALPIAASGILQLLFNAADVVVIGQYTDRFSLAAVTSTGTLINLIVNLFIGLSVGVVAILARAYGAKDEKQVHDIVHTAMPVSALIGLGVGIFGYFFSATLLHWVGSPDDVLPLATIYMQIYFLGAPGNFIYNFGSAVLRAVGDSRRPLIFLTISGVVNFLLNLFLVIVVDLGVAGVAIATAVSQYLSAVLVVICLLRENGSIRLNLREMKIKKTHFLSILRVGLPSGIQSALFGLSNVLMQSSVNSFGAVVIAGSGISSNIEGFIFTGMNAFAQTALAFAGQNYGARKPERIRKVFGSCLLLVTAAGVLLGGLALLFRYPLLGIYSNDTEVVEQGAIRLQLIACTYFLCGIMNVASEQLRGIGYSAVPTIVSLIGACGFRIVWIYTFFRLPALHTLIGLYYCWPISWAITTIALVICYAFLSPRAMKRIR